MHSEIKKLSYTVSANKKELNLFEYLLVSNRTLDNIVILKLNVTGKKSSRSNIYLLLVVIFIVVFTFNCNNTFSSLDMRHMCGALLDILSMHLTNFKEFCGNAYP